MDWNNLPDVDKLTEAELRAELRVRRDYQRYQRIAVIVCAIAGVLAISAALLIGGLPWRPPS